MFEAKSNPGTYHLERSQSQRSMQVTFSYDCELRSGVQIVDDNHVCPSLGYILSLWKKYINPKVQNVITSEQSTQAQSAHTYTLYDWLTANSGPYVLIWSMDIIRCSSISCWLGGHWAWNMHSLKLPEAPTTAYHTDRSRPWQTHDYCTAMISDLKICLRIWCAWFMVRQWVIRNA